MTEKVVRETLNAIDMRMANGKITQKDAREEKFKYLETLEGDDHRVALAWIVGQ